MICKLNQKLGVVIPLLFIWFN